MLRCFLGRNKGGYTHGRKQATNQQTRPFLFLKSPGLSIYSFIITIISTIRRFSDMYIYITIVPLSTYCTYIYLVSYTSHLFLYLFYIIFFCEELGTKTHSLSFTCLFSFPDCTLIPVAFFFSPQAKNRGVLELFFSFSLSLSHFFSELIMR